MNVSQVTQNYIRARSSVAECLSRGLVNYSALAREICDHHKIDSFDAVLMACRRYKAEREHTRLRDDKAVSLLKSAKVVLRTKIISVQIEKGNTLQRALSLQQLVRKERGDFRLIEGEEVITLITNEQYLPAIKETFERNVKRVTANLVQITLVISEKLATTPGVCAHLYRLFAEAGINLCEEMSCWTDIMVVIHEKDSARAMALLSS